jgi:antitoxin component YwqK of YwqJK toxin-antitoxin module
MRIPFEFTSEEENRLIKENDSLKFFVADDDSTNIVTLNEEASYYKLLSKDHKVLAEGSYLAEGDKYLQDGRWSQYYSGGKVKITGYYRRNKLIGTWQEYYPTGKLKTVANYAAFTDKGETYTCKSGSYQEYYASGKLKLSGFYSADLHKVKDTVVVEDPVSGERIQKILEKNKPTAEKTGRWEYYTEDGELEKKEDL